MKLRNIRLGAVPLALLFAQQATAGPLVPLILALPDIIADAVGVTAIGNAFTATIDSGALWAVPAQAGAGAAVGVVVSKHSAEVAHASKVSVSSVKSVSSVSVKSASSAASVASVSSHSSIKAQLSASAAAAIASAEGQGNGAKPTSKGKRDSAPAPVATGVAANGLVPAYNVQQCQTELENMMAAGQKISLTTLPNTQNPQATDVRVDGIPPTCMVLANILFGSPAAGPHPFAAGSAAIQWGNVTDDQIAKIKAWYDNPPA